MVNCGGIFAAEIGRMAGVRVPIVPMSHQYVVTEPLSPAAGARTPCRACATRTCWSTTGRRASGLLMGGYERNAAPFTAGADRYDAVPADFNAKLLPEDWERFVEIAENAAIRVPAHGRRSGSAG